MKMYHADQAHVRFLLLFFVFNLFMWNLQESLFTAMVCYVIYLYLKWLVFFFFLAMDNIYTSKIKIKFFQVGAFQGACTVQLSQLWFCHKAASWSRQTAELHES